MQSYKIIGKPIIQKEKIFKNIKLPFNFTVDITKFKELNYLVLYDKLGNTNSLCYYIKNTNFPHLKEIEIPIQCLKHQVVIDYNYGLKGKLADYYIYNYDKISDCYLSYSMAIDKIYLTNPKIIYNSEYFTNIIAEVSADNEEILIVNANLNLQQNQKYLLLGIDNNTNTIKDAYLIYSLENITINEKENIFTKIKNKKAIFYHFYGNFSQNLQYKIYTINNVNSGLIFIFNKLHADGILRSIKAKYTDIPIINTSNFIIIPFKIDSLAIPTINKTIYSEYIENCPIAYIKYKNEICKIQFINEKEFEIVNSFTIVQNPLNNNELAFDIFDKHIQFYIDKDNALYYMLKNYWGDLFFNYQEEENNYQNDLIVLENKIANEKNYYINTQNYLQKLIENENLVNSENILIFYGYRNEFDDFYSQLIELRQKYSLYYLTFVCFKDIIYPNKITNWRSNIENVSISVYDKIITLQTIDIHNVNHVFIFNEKIYIDRIENDIDDIKINDILGIKVNNRLLLYKVISVNSNSILAIIEKIEDNAIITNIEDRQFYHFKEIFISNINNINFYYRILHEIPYDIFLRQLKPIEDDYIVYVEPLAIVNNVVSKGQNNIIELKKEIHSGINFAKYRINDLLKDINLFSFTYDKRFISYIENNNELKRYLKDNGIDIIDNILYRYSITSTNLSTNFIYKIVLLSKMQYQIFSKIVRRYEFNKHIIENAINMLIKNYKMLVSGVKELKINYQLDNTRTMLILHTKLNLEDKLVKNIIIEIK